MKLGEGRDDIRWCYKLHTIPPNTPCCLVCNVTNCIQSIQTLPVAWCVMLQTAYNPPKLSLLPGVWCYKLHTIPPNTPCCLVCDVTNCIQSLQTLPVAWCVMLQTAYNPSKLSLLPGVWCYKLHTIPPTLPVAWCVVLQTAYNSSKLSLWPGVWSYKLHTISPNSPCGLVCGLTNCIQFLQTLPVAWCVVLQTAYNYSKKDDSVYGLILSPAVTHCCKSREGHFMSSRWPDFNCTFPLVSGCWSPSREYLKGVGGIL